MKAHDLARLLLAGPDVPVAVQDSNDPCFAEVLDGLTTPTSTKKRKRKKRTTVNAFQFFGTRFCNRNKLEKQSGKTSAG